MRVDLQKVSKKILDYERKIVPSSCMLVAGVDEVGRGSVAGPVVAGAVIFPKRIRVIRGVYDSKYLSSRQREELSPKIIEKALAVGIGIISNEIIDQVNIFHATIRAMRKALENLSVRPDFVIVDAMHIPDLDVSQKSIIKGDEKCFSIAAASIVAKVYRDSLMKNLHDEFPNYNFKSNKGYYTRAHVKAIQEHGLCSLHRVSFPVLKKYSEKIEEF